MSFAILDDKIKKSNIVFIDDQIEDLRNYINQLEREGYKSILEFDKLLSLNEIVKTEPILVILDLEGVATELDPENEGISVLEYLKKHCPFAKVLIFSGHDKLDVAHSKKIEIADKKVKKGAISLKDFVCIVEDLIQEFYDPVKQKEIIIRLLEEEGDLKSIIDKSSFLKKRSLNKIVREIKNERKDIRAEDILNCLNKLKTELKEHKEIVSIIGLFFEIFG